MKKTTISKNGKSRTIYVPDIKEKTTLRHLVGPLTQKAERLCTKSVHGFLPGKSPVTNAQAHLNYQHTLSFDLKDFFDTITKNHVSGKLSEKEMEVVLVDGSPRQGLPTSPAVSNLAALDLDKAILKWLPGGITYTRYADDLTFSYNNSSFTELLKAQIPLIVSRCGFKINTNKTKYQSAKGGRRIITGVAVDTSLHPTRKIKRKLRAALHQNNLTSVKGLEEWCKLKLPNKKKFVNQEEAKRLCKVWRLGRIRSFPDKETEILTDDIMISGDPVYMLGISTWTTGWKTCYTQPNGKYRRTAQGLAYLEGARVAVFLGNKTMMIGGIERRVMRARALVYALEDGQKLVGALYGNPDDAAILLDTLRQIGYVSIRDVPPGIYVKGEIPYFCRIWSNMTAVYNKDSVRLKT